MTFDKELLFKSSLPEAEVEIPGKGTVRVRALTHDEALGISKGIRSEADAHDRRAQIERRMLALAMVDPPMTEDEVGRWQKASVAGEIEPVGKAIQRLSGMLPEADKEAYVEFEENPDSEFRLPPG